MLPAGAERLARPAPQPTSPPARARTNPPRASAAGRRGEGMAGGGGAPAGASVGLDDLSMSSFSLVPSPGPRARRPGRGPMSIRREPEPGG
jgi:hypothetical protein